MFCGHTEKIHYIILKKKKCEDLQNEEGKSQQNEFVNFQYFKKLIICLRNQKNNK